MPVMLPTLPLKKLVVEVRYKPELAFYTRMDAVGTELADHYPDWVRSPLTVEVRNKKKHQRVFLSHQRTFYEADLARPDPMQEFGHAEETLAKICSRLSLTAVARLGVRQWFACDLEKSFACMVDEFAARFLSNGEDVATILTDRMSDMLFVRDCETSDGWKYRLALSPMTKEQWFQTVGYEQNLFELPEEENATATFDDFRSTLPETFLFLDIDCFQEDVAVNQVKELMATFRRRSHELAKKLIEFCRR